MCCRTAFAFKPLSDSPLPWFLKQEISLVPFHFKVIYCQKHWQASNTGRSPFFIHSRLDFRKFWCQGKQNSFPAGRLLFEVFCGGDENSKIAKIPCVFIVSLKRFFYVFDRIERVWHFPLFFVLFPGPPGTKHHRFFSKKEILCRIKNAAHWTLNWLCLLFLWKFDIFVRRTETVTKEARLLKSCTGKSKKEYIGNTYLVLERLHFPDSCKKLPMKGR